VRQLDVTNDDAILLARITDYVAGEGSDSTRADMEQLLESSTEARVLHARVKAAFETIPIVDVARADDVMRTVGEAIRTRETAAAFTSRGNAGTPRDSNNRSTAEKMHLPRFGTLFARGATFAVLGAIIAGVVLGPRTTNRWSEHRYITRTGERATLSLADGSRVTLGPRSELVTTGAPRTVHLTGEAFFTVAAGTGTPFIVRSGTVATKVLGTEFDVRHYPTDGAVVVAVTAGKVAVTSTTARAASLVVTAGKIGVMSDSGNVLARGDDITQYTAWTDGHLVFDRALVSDVLATLERWYGYKFRLVNPDLAQRHVTTTLDYADPTQSLKKLELLLNVDLSLDGDSVILRPKRRASREPDVQRRDPNSLLSPSAEVGR